jgi:hypothetical protein
MLSDDNSFTDKLSAFFNSVWEQFCVAVDVGLPANDDIPLDGGNEAGVVAQPTNHVIRSLDDYSGYQTRSGLGSMDIGGSRSRIDE